MNSRTEDDRFILYNMVSIDYLTHPQIASKHEATCNWNIMVQFQLLLADWPTVVGYSPIEHNWVPILVGTQHVLCGMSPRSQVR
jgi:hypothetical protein